jgi:hypothetical protein
MLRNRHSLRLVRIPGVLIALVTLAFAIATTVYAAHVHDPAKKSAVTHCEICVQLSGSASAPPPPSLAGFVALFAYEAAGRCFQSFIATHRARAHRSRAPPSPVIT